MNNWRIVKSESDKHPEYGYPMGEVLCRSQKEADDYIETSEFKDCFMREYHPEKAKGNVKMN